MILTAKISLKSVVIVLLMHGSVIPRRRQVRTEPKKKKKATKSNYTVTLKYYTQYFQMNKINVSMKQEESHETGHE